MTARNTKQQAPVDVEAIAPELEPVELDGVPVWVRRIRTKEALLIIRILTRGLGPNIQYVDWDAEDKEAQGLSLILMAVPEAMTETLDLIRAVVEPQDPDQRRELNDALSNPSIEATIDVVMAIYKQEKDEFRALWGKVSSLLEKMR